MIPTIATERIAGALLLLFIAVMAGSLFAGGAGIGAEPEYFREDFPRLAAGLDRFQRVNLVLALEVVSSLILIAAAAALYLTFRPHDSALATLGAFLLLSGGTLFLVDAAAGRALQSLAGEWRTARGIEGDAIWTSARAVALMYEFLGFVAIFLVLGSFAVFGSLVFWKGPMPRWVGGLAVISGVLLVLSAVSAPLAGDGFFLIGMGSALFAVIWAVITGVWLLLRGFTGTLEAPGA